LDRPTNTSDGSPGGSPTVVTEWHDDDDDLMAGTDQDTQIIPATPARAARTAVARAAAAEVLANGNSATARDGQAADEQDDAADEVPALPADTIGLPRDPASFGRPVSSPVSPDTGDGWTPAAADDDASSLAGMGVPADFELVESELAGAGPMEAGPVVAETGTGWPIDGTTAETDAYHPAGDPASPASESATSTVSAASFVWNPPEPAPTSASSPARNFLRSSTSAKTSAPPPRTPAVSVGPAKSPGGAGGAAPAAGPRPKGSAKRSARQAHLTVARVEPWSVTKLSFIVSLVAFVILFVAVAVIYGTLSALGVFTSLQHVVQSVTSSQDSNGVNAAKWFTASRVLSWTAILGVVNIVLITAMSTIGAVVYNLTSRLIGGVEVTLRETE
jgi:Transmembrane domain of unknown function (DUF3566)